jgi:hypothetical protein
MESAAQQVQLSAYTGVEKRFSQHQPPEKATPAEIGQSEKITGKSSPKSQDYWQIYVK